MKKDLKQLSPQEKRQLLAELLRQKGRRRPNPSPPTSPPASLGAFDQFTTTSTALEAEAVLHPAIRADGLPLVESEPSHLLLTGATGFLGAFLLAELLQLTPATITCLVRAPTAEAGRQRILAKLEGYLPGHNYDRSRIVAVAGDLAKPLLGLSPEQFRQLGDTIDVIYHSAAMVNWIDAYEKLKPSNVLGTQEILRLASTGRVKPVHYVSTLAVFPLVRNSHASVVREQDPLDHGGELYGGYTQSKWVAEKLVDIARGRGIPVTVYRPGLITGHSQLGSWNSSDFTCQLLKSWITTGYVPELDAMMDMTPVDFVSKAIAYLSQQSSATNKVFHLANPEAVSVQQLYNWMRWLGYELEPLPYDEWRTALIHLMEFAALDGLRALVPLLETRESEGAGRWVGSVPRFDCSNTQEALSEAGISCPAIDRQIIETYFSYLTGSGFLNAPQREEAR